MKWRRIWLVLNTEQEEVGDDEIEQTQYLTKKESFTHRLLCKISTGILNLFQLAKQDWILTPSLLTCSSVSRGGVSEASNDSVSSTSSTRNLAEIWRYT